MKKHFAPFITHFAFCILLSACQTTPPPADKTVRVDVYTHTSGLGIVESVLRLIPGGVAL